MAYSDGLMNDTNPPDREPPEAALTLDDFVAIENALADMRESKPETPVWEFLEGALAALVCTRRKVEPAEYWPVLLGDSFVPMQQMEFVWRWNRRWREVETALDADVNEQDDEDCYAPEVFDVRGAVAAAVADGSMPEPDEPTAPFGQFWAEGFLAVVEAWPQEWTLPREDEIAKICVDALYAIALLTQDDTDPPAASLPDAPLAPGVSERRMDEFNAAIWAVYDLRQIWKSYGPRTAPIRKDRAPGRNDPCPCGSGKKYKKCHGAM